METHCLIRLFQKCINQIKEDKDKSQKITNQITRGNQKFVCGFQQTQGAVTQQVTNNTFNCVHFATDMQ